MAFKEDRVRIAMRSRFEHGECNCVALLRSSGTAHEAKSCCGQAERARSSPRPTRSFLPQRSGPNARSNDGTHNVTTSSSRSLRSSAKHFLVIIDIDIGTDVDIQEQYRSLLLSNMSAATQAERTCWFLVRRVRVTVTVAPPFSRVPVEK